MIYNLTKNTVEEDMAPDQPGRDDLLGEHLHQSTEHPAQIAVQNNIEESEAASIEMDLSNDPLTPLVEYAGQEDQPVGADEDASSDDCKMETNLQEVNFDPIAFVTQFLAELDLEILFDGSFRQKGKPTMALNREMIDAVLAVQTLSFLDVLDMMIIHIKTYGIDLKAGDVRAALRNVYREQKHARRNAIMKSVLQENPVTEAESVKVAWNCIDMLFEPIPGMSSSICIRHFIWQVKSKVLGRPVTHHLMPVITSSIQGSGKTTFVKMLTGPLKELVTGASLLSDFSDRRTLGLFRYPIVVLDDMEAISKESVSILKGVITGEDIQRRELGSSMDKKVPQMSTAIGTSNARIEDLIPDETGHRRFVTLLFRNGAVEKGGDPAVWQTVASLNYELLWRSVDPFKPSPLSEHLVALAQYQDTARTPTGLLKWLLELDIHSHAVRPLHVKKQGIAAEALHDLFEMQTGAQLSKQAFAKQMHGCMQNPLVPFGDKHRFEKMRVYRFRVDLQTSKLSKEASSAGPLEPDALKKNVFRPH